MIKRLLLMLPLSVVLLPLPTRGQTGGRAGLIVQFGDGSVRTSCVAFEGQSISSFELLQRSGLDVIAQTSGNNAAVCKIGGDGCDFPAEPCFCKFGSGQQGLYWAFWRLRASGWQYSTQGAGLRQIGNGEVDGWAWGSGNVQSGAQPPIIPFEQICPTAPPPDPTAPPPTAIPTVRPTPRPTVRPTAAPQPTAPIVASGPSATPRPSITSTALAASATPTEAATPTSSATSQPTAQPTASPTPSTRPTDGTTQTPTPIVASRSGSGPGSYLIFGTMLLGLLGAIGLVLWRRHR